MVSKVVAAFKILVLVLCITNFVWQVYEILFVGSGHWVSLGLLLYSILSLLLVLLNSIALLLPGSCTVPTVSLLIVGVGFIMFVLFPHRVVMF